MIILIGIGALFLLVGYFIWQARKSARREERGKGAIATVKKVTLAERVRLRLKSDKAERDRVEKKFTRRQK